MPQPRGGSTVGFAQWAPACNARSVPQMLEARANLRRRALVVDDELNDQSAAGHATRRLVEELKGTQVDVITATTADDARAIFGSDAAVQCVILDWDLKAGGDHVSAAALLSEIRARNATVPIFLLADRSLASTIPAKSMQEADDFIWLLEDTADFIAGRILAAIGRYRAQILPPMFAALVRFAEVHEYSWHTPGHAGGTAFLKSPPGRAFFDFFGESLLRSDLSISVGELGSLLDHSGPIGEGERYAARVFGAHRTYTVTNGTSTSNRVVLMAIVTRDLRCAPPVGRQKQENADESVSPSHYRPANRERQS